MSPSRWGNFSSLGRFVDEKPCGLISVVPPALQKDWAEGLAARVQRFRPAAIIVQPAGARLGRAIVKAAKPLEVAVLAAGSVEEAVTIEADGVYFLDPEPDVQGARKALGSASIVGAACGLSRHAAMLAAEDGADFVAFTAPPEASLENAANLCAWWNELAVVPVALDCGTRRPSRAVLEKAHADFVMLEEVESAGESLTFAKESGLVGQT